MPNRRIIRIGNSMGVIIPPDILDLFDFRLGDTIEIGKQGNRLILKKIQESDQEEISDVR